MAGHLCLKWNNHSLAFLKSISNIQLKERFCDATIACQGKYFPIHRVVLSTCSEYFDEMFERMQCQHPYIVFKDIDPKEMELLLNYMYQGEVNVLQENLPSLIKTAEALKVKGLAVPDDPPKPNKDHSSGKKRSCSSNENSMSKRRMEERQKRRESSLQTAESNGEPTQDQNLSRVSENKEVMDPPLILKEEPADHNEYVGEQSFPLESVENPTKSEQMINVFAESLDKSATYIKTENCPPQNEELEGQSSWCDYGNSLPDFPPPPLEDLMMYDGNRGSKEDTLAPELQLRRSEDTGRDANLSGGTYQAGSQSAIGLLDLPRTMRGYRCPTCPYGSQYKKNVIRHIMFKHTREKPYQCSRCPMRFTINQHLKIHMRKHTGEKPYRCSICLVSFTHSGSLKYHVKRKHSSEP